MANTMTKIENVEPKQVLSKGIILLLASACGMAVANLYYIQPLLANIGRAFGASVREVGSVAMLTQIGYAVGMFLFVPLGDMRERRKLIVTMLVAVTVSLVCVATSQNITWLYIASLALGFTTVIPQIIVPLAAQLAPPAERGKVIGSVMSGLLIGVLLARTVSGIIGGMWGWRSVYWIAAVLMLTLAVVLGKVLPPSFPESKLTYPQLIKSIGTLARTQPILREASLIGALTFSAFSIFWTALAFFLEGEPYYFGAQITGLFGLVGVCGAAAASVAGRLADRFRAKTIVVVFMGLALLSYLFFWGFGFYLWGLILGVILIDLGMQGAQVTNQTRIYALLPEARSRLNTVFMVSTFLGGSFGSFAGSYAWSRWQWTGVCAAGTLMIVAALCVWGYSRMKESRAS